MQTQISNYVEIEGKKLYYEEAGEGEVLVLAHAGFLDSGMWDGQWEAFGKHYRVIRYDMRGYGKSGPLDGPTSRRAELYALLKQLGVEKAYLVGCSMGGEVMLDFTIEHPEMVRGLVTVNSTPGGFEFQGEPPAELLEMMEAAQKQDLARISELQMRIWIDGPFRQPDEVNPQVRRRASEMNQTPVRNGTWAVAEWWQRSRGRARR
jgi:pimeloyl-ACP methyl ester carboxylesterase